MIHSAGKDSRPCGFGTKNSFSERNGNNPEGFCLLRFFLRKSTLTADNYANIINYAAAESILKPRITATLIRHYAKLML